MEPRDIILTVNGVEVTSAQDTLTRIANAKPGDKVKITGLRGTQTFSSEVLVSERGRAHNLKFSEAAPHNGNRRAKGASTSKIRRRMLTIVGRRRRSRRSCAS